MVGVEGKYHPLVSLLTRHQDIPNEIQVLHIRLVKSQIQHLYLHTLIRALHHHLLHHHPLLHIPMYHQQSRLMLERLEMLSDVAPQCPLEVPVTNQVSYHVLR